MIILKILNEIVNFNKTINNQLSMGIDLGGGWSKFSIVDNITKKIVFTKSNCYRLTKSILENNGYIPDYKIKETIEILRDYLNYAKEYKCTKVICCATGGLRIAKNSENLIQRVKKELGLDIKIISGNEEAKLNWKGTLLAFEESVGNIFLIIDIGSTSTEISYGNKTKILSSSSFEIGTQIFINKFNIANRKIDDSEFDEMKRFLNSIIGNRLMSIKNKLGNSNIKLIVTGSCGFNIIETAIPQVDEWDIKKKGTWGITYDMVVKSLNISKNLEFQKERVDNISVFAHSFMIKYIMDILNIKNITYSFYTLKEGLAIFG